MSFIVSTTGINPHFIISDILNKVSINHPMVNFDLELVIPRNQIDSSNDISNALNNNWIKLSGTEGSNNNYVIASPSDTSPSSLINKIAVAGSITSLSEINTLSGKKVVITTKDELIKTSNNDTNSGYLLDKLEAGANVVIDEVTILGNKKVRVAAGVSGSGSSLEQYTHTQNTPQKIWTINHNLGKKPSISFFDQFGEPFVGYYLHLDSNTSQGIFNIDTLGTAECNI